MIATFERFWIIDCLILVRTLSRERVVKGSVDGYPLGANFINEGRGFSPTHLKFFLLVFSQIKRSQREDQA